MNKFLLVGLGLTCLCSKASDFKLESSSFKDKTAMPAKFAMKAVTGGQNISPQLSWKNPPEGAKSFVISCIDKHKIANFWVHWMVVDIPANCNSLPEGASLKSMPTDCRELENSFGDIGWGGPQPPKGTGNHEYVFTIFALKTEKSGISQKFISESELRKKLKDAIIGEASISAYFSR